jgi:four helix bundle protein
MSNRGVVRTFKDLIVWQRAFELAVGVYRSTDALPRHERYGLTAEIRKTVRSISYNIAEGHRRASTAEYLRFLDIARGSAAELETQFLLGHALGYLEKKVWTSLLAQLGDVDRMLAALIRRLRQRAPRPLALPPLPSLDP